MLAMAPFVPSATAFLMGWSNLTHFINPPPLTLQAANGMPSFGNVCLHAKRSRKDLGRAAFLSTPWQQPTTEQAHPSQLPRLADALSQPSAVA